MIGDGGLLTSETASPALSSTPRRCRPAVSAKIRGHAAERADRLPGIAGQRQPGSDRCRKAHRRRLGAARDLRPRRPRAQGARPKRDLCRRGRSGASRQDRPQRVPGCRHPVAGRDHGARRTRRCHPRTRSWTSSMTPSWARRSRATRSPAIVNLDFPPTFTMPLLSQRLRPRPLGRSTNSRFRCRSPQPPPSSSHRDRRRPHRRRLRRAPPRGRPDGRHETDPRERARQERTRSGRHEYASSRSRRPGHSKSTMKCASTWTGFAHTASTARRSRLEGSECGAFLLFDFYNIRYTTQTWIGGALGDKMTRYALLTRSGEPDLWDFGSAVRHHQLYSPWLKPEETTAGVAGVAWRRRTVAGLMESAVREIKALLVAAGVADAARRSRHRRAALPLRDAAPGPDGSSTRSSTCSTRG